VPIYYDPMISKLVAWDSDRLLAIARMRRALGEYVIAGIKTTVPFFTWLLTQQAFLEGRFHTTFLDDILRERNGRSFVEPSSSDEEQAAMAAALQTVLSSGEAPSRTEDGTPVSRRWKDRARAEGLR
jgi:acetyl-CoA carboxylase biotin carboxylase subunit